MKRNTVQGLLLLLGCTLLFNRTTFSQSNSLTITHAIVSDHGSWSTANPIPLCSGNSTMTVTFTNNYTVPISAAVQQVFPTIPPSTISMIVPNIGTIDNPCGLGLDLQSEGFLFSITNLPANGTCEVSFDFTISCSSIVEDEQDLTISYTTTNPIILSGSPYHFQISKPKMLIENFRDHNSALMANQTNNQLLNLTNETYRSFDLRVANGVIEEFTFSENTESEIDFIRYELEGFLSSGISTNQTMIIYDEFQNAGSIVNSLFPQGYMVLGNFIRVREYFSVVSCSSNPNDGTDWEVSWPCHFNETCNTTSATRAIRVRDGSNYFTRGLSITPAFDICGQDSSSIVFAFGNSNIDLTIDIPGSGGRRIEQVIFPFDVNWLTIGSVWLVDGSCPTCATNITSAPYFVIDNVSKRCTLNVNQIPQNTIVAPFQDMYLTDGYYHELPENRSFRIEFRDTQFNCSAGTFYNGGTFDNCEKASRNGMLFGPSANTHFQITFATMCDIAADTNRVGNWEYANYSNNFPMTALAEASPTDVVESVQPNAQVEFYYSYSGGLPNPSPFIFNAALSPANLFFHCDTVKYNAEIWIPEVFDLNLDSTKHFPNPNSLADTLYPIPQYVTTATEGLINYNVYRLDDIGYAGLIRIWVSVNDENCQDSTGGFATIRMQLRAVCDDCESCAYTIRCIDTQIYYHCDGPCNSLVGTDEYSFNFNRTTLGWMDSTLTSSVTPSISGIKINRAYSCDHIDVSAEGTVSVNSLLEDIFFMIDYESDVSFQFYEYVDGTGTFSFTPNGGGPIADDPITATDLVGFNVNSTACSLRVYIDPAKAALLNQYGGEISFQATFRVKEMTTNSPPDGFYPMPQVRGQFVGEFGNSLALSCDSWGDNMTVLKVRTSRGNWDGVLCDGAANAAESLGDLGICRRWLFLSTYVTGGMPGLDEFPAEFRPITLWPEANSQDFIELELPNGFSFSQNASFAKRNESTWTPVVTQVTGNTLSFRGLTGQNDWPILENDGSGQIRHRLKAVLNNDCPPSAPVDTATVIFPYTKRAFAIDSQGCAQAVVDTNVYNNISPSEYSYLLTTSAPPNGITLYSVSGVIGGFTIKYSDLTGCAGETAGAMQNAWVRNISNGIQINSIIRTINNVSVTITPNGLGYFELGNLGHTQNVFIQLNYEITDCDSIGLALEYGFACLGYEEEEHYECGINLLEVPIMVADSEIEMEVIALSNLTGSPCNIYEFDVHINNTDFADAEELAFSLTMPAGMTIIASSYALGNGSPISIPYSANCLMDTCQYDFDLNSEAYNDEGMPSGSSIIVHLSVTGDCPLHGAEPELRFTSHALDICGDTIYPDNNNYELSLDFPISIPLGKNCTSLCDSCSADFTISQTSDCCYLIEDLTPDVMPCPKGGFGIFRADTSWVATYQGVTSFEHCFEEDGDYLICSTVCCADSSFDKVCQLITVTGCNDECEGFEITAVNDGCDYTFTAVHPSVNSPTYGWWVGYNGIVEWNNTGILNHTYPPGYYQDVCYTIFYNDSITNEPMECKVCMPIEVNCEPDCDVFDMQHTEKGDCKHGFEAILPPNFNGTNVSYCWYMDYSNTTFCPAGSSVGFTYPAGTYTVCYEITYTDSNYAEPVTCKVCREYEFKCDKAEEFCYIIERKDVPDEGKVITPLKDGGYLVSGEMHGNGTNLDMYFAQVKDDFTSDYNYLLNEVIGELSDIGTVYSTLEVGNKVYILGKSTKSDATSADLVLACLDASTQNVLWAKRHGTTKMDIGSKILLLNESTLLITGHTNYYGSANDSYDLFAMTTDLSGTLMAVEVYQPTEFASSEVSTDAVLIPDSHGQFVIAGYNINAEGKRDMVALKVNTDLTPASNMLFIGDSKDDWANGITIAGDYIYLVGATGDLKYKDYHIYVAEVKTNSFTQTIASRVYTPRYKASVANKVIHENGSLVLVGDLYSNENDADRYRGAILQLLCNDKDSKHLDVLWSAKTLEEAKNVRFNHLTAYQEARLLVTGMLDHAENERDIFVVNVDIKTGEGCCVEPLSYEKKLQNKSSDRTATSNRPLWEVKAYGQRSTHFALVEICKKDDKGGNPEASASVKMLHTDFNVFPNPNAGYFSVQLSHSDDMFQLVTIFDTAGRKVFDKNYSNEKSGMTYLEIDAYALSSGVYMLQVEGRYGTSTKLISISK